jgi:hypothetical protein
MPLDIAIKSVESDYPELLIASVKARRALSHFIDEIESYAELGISDFNRLYEEMRQAFHAYQFLINKCDRYSRIAHSKPAPKLVRV